MTDKALKPCPFCGDAPDANNDGYFQLTDGYKYGALVCSCGVHGPEVRTDYKEVEHWKQSAIEEWNRRAPDEDLADAVSKALRKAWQLGQRYWQQADSEFRSQHKAADETQRKFDLLVDGTRAMITAAPQPPKST